MRSGVFVQVGEALHQGQDGPCGFEKCWDLSLCPKLFKQHLAEDTIQLLSKCGELAEVGR